MRSMRGGFIDLVLHVTTDEACERMFVQGQGAEGGEPDHERLQEGEAHFEARLRHKNENSNQSKI